MVITAQPRVASYTPSASASQPKTQLAPGDAYVPSSVDPTIAAAGGAVIGGGLGVYAGLSSGVFSGLAGVAAGAGTGMVVAGLVGGVVGRVLDPKNEWSGVSAAVKCGKIGAGIGAVGGGVAGLLGSSGVAPAVILGVGGALGGALAAYFIAEANT